MASINLIYGKDEYLKKNNLNNIIKKRDSQSINKVEFLKPNFEELEDEILLPSFLKEQKIITVYNSNYFSNKKKNEKEYEKIIGFFKDAKKLEDIFEDLTLCFIEEEVDNKNELYKIFVKNEKSNPKLFAVKSYDRINANDRKKLLLSLAKKDKLEMGIQEVTYLSEMVEDETYTLINEYNKLKYLDNNNITIKDIDRVCIKTEQSKIYEITNELQKGNKQKAFELIDEMCITQSENSVLGYIYGYIRKIYLTSISMKEGTTNNLEKLLELKPNQRFLVNRYIQFAKKNGIKRLKYILQELSKIDSDSKTYKTDVCTRIKCILNILV